MPSRSAWTIPRMSTATMSAGCCSSSSRMIALPAAPTPETTILQSRTSLPTTRSALRSAATTQIAVPCWSSWNTGMSSSSRSRASISKQRGAEMSSRLMPPYTGAISWTVRMISSGSVVSRQTGQASTPANLLNSAALPSITGSAAAGPTLPSPSTAVPSVTTATVLRLIVSRRASAGLSAIACADPRDPRRVGPGQVVAVAQRHLGGDLDLAAEVHQEGPVRDLADRDPVERVDRVGEQLSRAPRTARSPRGRPPSARPSTRPRRGR